MVAVRDYVPVVFASVVVCVCIELKLTVIADVVEAVAVLTRVVDAPTAVVDAAVVAVHSLELV